MKLLLNLLRGNLIKTMLLDENSWRLKLKALWLSESNKNSMSPTNILQQHGFS